MYNSNKNRIVLEELKVETQYKNLHMKVLVPKIRWIRRNPATMVEQKNEVDPNIEDRKPPDTFSSTSITKESSRDKHGESAGTTNDDMASYSEFFIPYDETTPTTMSGEESKREKNANLFPDNTPTDPNYHSERVSEGVYNADEKEGLNSSASSKENPKEITDDHPYPKEMIDTSMPRILFQKEREKPIGCRKSTEIPLEGEDYSKNEEDMDWEERYDIEVTSENEDKNMDGLVNYTPPRDVTRIGRINENENIPGTHAPKELKVCVNCEQPQDPAKGITSSENIVSISPPPIKHSERGSESLKVMDKETSKKEVTIDTSLRPHCKVNLVNLTTSSDKHIPEKTSLRKTSTNYLRGDFTKDNSQNPKFDIIQHMMEKDPLNDPLPFEDGYEEWIKSNEKEKERAISPPRMKSITWNDEIKVKIFGKENINEEKEVLTDDKLSKMEV